MTDRRAPFGAILAAVAACVSASGTLAAAAPAVAPKLPQWEYLVVSAGKTRFTPVLAATLAEESKAAVSSEAMWTFESEATELQQRMDDLGHLGWELVAVVGAIGGDQQLLFKRPYVADLVQSEAAIRHQRAELWLLAIAPSPAPPGITDLDEKERLDRLTNNLNLLRAKLDAALANLPQGVRVEDNELRVIPAEPRSGDRASLGGTLTVDATDRLLLTPENTYRSHVADELANSICWALVRIGARGELQGLPVPAIVEVRIKGTTVARKSGTWISMDGKLF